MSFKLIIFMRTTVDCLTDKQHHWYLKGKKKSIFIFFLSIVLTSLIPFIFSFVLRPSDQHHVFLCVCVCF